jgi:putative oxidoreductase
MASIAVGGRTGWDDVGKLILRLTVAGLMIFHGIAKMKGGIGWMGPMLSSHGIPPFVGYGVFVAEVIAPLLLLLGIYTRVAALVIAFDMFMAIILVVKGNLFAISPRGGGLGGEVELFYLLTSVAIFFLGAGRFSVRRGASAWD